MTRNPPDTSPRQRAYGWQRVKGSSYRCVDSCVFIRLAAATSSL
jgi:hypothetical protein